MTLGPGDPWGRPGIIPADLVIARSDAECAELAREGATVVGLAGGDLCRTLGGRGDIAERRGTEGMLCPIDVGIVEVDTRAVLFVAHVVLHGLGWVGESAAVMNAEWFGPLRLGPRAHPGDGVFDITQGALPWRDLLEARTRARTGDHLPHPALKTSRRAGGVITLARARPVFVDGVDLGRHRGIAIGLRPEPITVVV